MQEVLSLTHNPLCVKREISRCRSDVCLLRKYYVMDPGLKTGACRNPKGGLQART